MSDAALQYAISEEKLRQALQTIRDIQTLNGVLVLMLDEVNTKKLKHEDREKIKEIRSMLKRFSRPDPKAIKEATAKADASRIQLL